MLTLIVVLECQNPGRLESFYSLVLLLPTAMPFKIWPSQL